MTRFLLDTHVALWWFSAHPSLSELAKKEISSAQCHLSACSIWEIAIKFRLGKLPVSPEVVLSTASQAGIFMLPVLPEHAAATARLTDIHSDPFDRMLVAQASHEKLILLTNDKTLLKYGDNIRPLP